MNPRPVNLSGYGSKAPACTSLLPEPELSLLSVHQPEQQQAQPLKNFPYPQINYLQLTDAPLNERTAETTISVRAFFIKQFAFLAGSSTDPVNVFYSWLLTPSREVRGGSLPAEVPRKGLRIPQLIIQSPVASIRSLENMRAWLRRESLPGRVMAKHQGNPAWQSIVKNNAHSWLEEQFVAGAF